MQRKSPWATPLLWIVTRATFQGVARQPLSRSPGNRDRTCPRTCRVAWAALTCSLGWATSGAELAPSRLRCEYLANPLAIESRQPRLSWTLESDGRGARQSAWQVMAATDPARLASGQPDLWDSGKVISDQTAHIPYPGRQVSSTERVYWQVRVWDSDNNPSPWSERAFWQMGLLDAADWRAKWISQNEPELHRGPLPLFRREFRVDKPVRRATAHVSGLGFFELHLNGRKVGRDVLEPGWTNYRKRCLYVTFDVTDQLQPGVNALGVMLGNGMFNVSGGRYTKFTGSFGLPKLILQLRIEHADGTSTEVVSDGSWKAAPGPVQFSCIYGGEDYDARREQPGWDLAGYDDAHWRPAIVTDGPGGRLAPQTAPPIQVTRTFETATLTQPRPGIFVADLGFNFSGWPRLTVRGPAGATVKLIPGELIDTNGLVTQRSSGGPTYFAYTLKGGGVESWHPRFTYTGFRYVQIEGAAPPGAPAASAEGAELLGLQGHFTRSSAQTVGRFECSNPLINRIHSLILAAIESNLQSVLTDCPHREKLGWLEVSHLLGPAIMFNYDVPRLYRKICDDMAEAQLEDGLVPDIAPEFTVFTGGFRDSPEWGSACTVNPWLLYQRYADAHALAEHYDVMKRYAGFLGGRARGHILSHGLGDWYDIGPGAPGESKLTTKGVTATAIYYQNLEILRQAAALLGKTDDARAWAGRAAEVRQAFNRTFYNAATGQYDRGSQTAQAMPLVLGLVEPAHAAPLLDRLVEQVRAQGNQVTAGDVGFRFLVEALRRGDRSDVLFDLVTREQGPGYADQLQKGATTLTEAWDADPASSQNHCMLGHVEEWFYTGLGGINPDPSAPGFKKILIQPQPVGDLTWVRTSYESVHGRIASEWKRDAGRFTLELTVPPNTTATVFLPAKEERRVTESGTSLPLAGHVRFLRLENGRAAVAVGSGRYHFVSQLE